ncbi:MAG: phage regulatory CII family protein [Rhodospirillaceae bacterium]
MTLYRSPGSIKSVLAEVIRQLTPEEIEAATGKKPGTFRQLSHPENDYQLDLDDAAFLDAALEARGLLPAFGPLFEDMKREAAASIGGRRSGALSVERGLVRVSAELGTLAHAIDRAMEDGELTLNERREIATKAQRLIDAARTVRAAVDRSGADRTVKA